MLVRLSDSDAGLVALVGGKASRLAVAAVAGFPVPDGFVVAVGDEVSDAKLTEAAASLAPRVAVRSSAMAEDLAGASFAGLYETFLNVPPGQVPESVRRCRATADADRVRGYRSSRSDHGVAVLVQAMVPAQCAGVAFTADPLTGSTDAVVVTAVRGLADHLVGGAVSGEEWRVTGGTATPTSTALPTGPGLVLTADQAVAVAAMAVRLQTLFQGPQDVEWAIAGDQLYLLQARPMTALASPACWDVPGRGLWACNFRLGEWLPDPVTPLFGDWLLPVFDEGFRAGMNATAGAEVRFPYALVNGWYYATPNPALSSIPAAVLRSRGRILRFMVATLLEPGRDPGRADRTLQVLYKTWRGELVPAYQRLAGTDPEPLDLGGLTLLVEQILQSSGRHFWYLAVVGGAAWKMEQGLDRFHRRHGLGAVPAADLLTGLGAPTAHAPYAVFCLDWFHPTAGEHRAAAGDPPIHPPTDRGNPALQGRSRAAEERCRSRLAGDHDALDEWAERTDLARRYARIRQEQTDQLTLAWPLLRRCADLIAGRLTKAGVIDDPELMFFLNRAELRGLRPASVAAAARREQWRGDGRLLPPLTLGMAPWPLRRLMQTVGGTAPGPDPARQLVGQPASPGRATGPVRVVRYPDDLPTVRPGEVLVAPLATPAWTPVLDRVVAVVTDRGTAAAHAAILAREYGIPAVVATGDATHRLTGGSVVTVDGGRGVVTIN